MSDSYISIVPEKVEKGEAKKLAVKILNHLVQRGIVQRKLTDCTLGNDGHPPGGNFQDSIQGEDTDLMQVLPNGLEVITTREVFHNGGDYLEEVSCPTCKTNIVETDWMQLLDEWKKETGNDLIVCPQCNSNHSISNFIFSPTWGFGELGLTFWNWSNFKEEFIREIEQVLERKVKIVYGRL